MMPFFYFPIFYQVKELVFWDGTTPLTQVPTTAARKYVDGFAADLISATQVCLPINFILLSSIPAHLRIPTLSALGMVWVITLSTRRGEQIDEVPIPTEKTLSITEPHSSPEPVYQHLG
mmetsp:Transcript_12845/g.31510  ORF Transcript_12845/g.31510 Transcript_12845/m.31510 type:complete len:119 (-) Transcript_12845:280-636(-)